ncbi:hypothetical protein C8J57DRAFT_1464458 [Mycena rebaudengoi]|nr:hypothetical protein C8J57DRAFT_1464458 [Mycena rebaudengoi]
MTTPSQTVVDTANIPAGGVRPTVFSPTQDIGSRTDDHLRTIAQACTRSQRLPDLLVVRRHPKGTVIAHGNLSPASQRPYLPPPHPSFHRLGNPSPVPYPYSPPKENSGLRVKVDEALKGCSGRRMSGDSGDYDDQMRSLSEQQGGS